MAEYIDKAKVILRIDNQSRMWGDDYGITDVICDIDDFPTADVVEVVRCKDCTHKVDYCGRIMCDKNARRINDGIVGLIATSPDFFCSYGERKDAK